MLQTVLIVLPAVLGVSLAMLLMRKLYKENGSCGGATQPAFPVIPRSEDGEKEESNTRRRRNRQSENSLPQEECVVCFEQKTFVALYPCQHKKMCEKCTIEIICNNRRKCPLCRQRIQGYSN